MEKLLTKDMIGARPVKTGPADSMNTTEDVPCLKRVRPVFIKKLLNLRGKGRKPYYFQTQH